MSGYHWLASYPKSGNTWLRLALASLSRGGAAPDLAANVGFAPAAGQRAAFDQALDVDSADLTGDEIERLRPRFYEIEARKASGPQLRKVHDAWTRTDADEPLFPISVTRSVIYVVRDPRDVAVSFAHYVARDLDTIIAMMACPKAGLSRHARRSQTDLPQRLLSWSGHVRSWRDAPVPTLLLRYEDMLEDPATTLSRAARHLRWNAGEDEVARAVAATRFEVLRAAEDRVGFHERWRDAQRFFRRGVAGGWRDTLSPAQVDLIETVHGDVMAEFGYGGRQRDDRSAM